MCVHSWLPHYTHAPLPFSTQLLVKTDGTSLTLQCRQDLGRMDDGVLLKEDEFGWWPPSVHPRVSRTSSLYHIVGKFCDDNFFPWKDVQTEYNKQAWPMPMTTSLYIQILKHCSLFSWPALTQTWTCMKEPGWLGCMYIPRVIKAGSCEQDCACTHAHTHTYTYPHPCHHTHTHTTHTRIQTHTHTRIHMHTPTPHTHPHTPTHTHTHAHTHIHGRLKNWPGICHRGYYTWAWTTHLHSLSPPYEGHGSRLTKEAEPLWVRSRIVMEILKKEKLYMQNLEDIVEVIVIVLWTGILEWTIEFFCTVNYTSVVLAALVPSTHSVRPQKSFLYASSHVSIEAN